MEFTTSSVLGSTQILKNDHYVAIPITLDFTSVTATDNGYKIVKAGTPLKSASGGYVVSNDANATVILLADVREDRPVGAGVTHGFINKAKAEASWGTAYASTVAIADVKIQ